MNRTQGINDVTQVLKQYEEGTRNRDIPLLQSIFHENALMSGYMAGNLMVGSPQPFFDFLAANTVSPEYSSSIVAVEISGNTASATVYEDQLFDLSFVNNFQLIKTEGKWLIVAKLFHHD